MPAPFKHVDTATLMGSWPISPRYSNSAQQTSLLPRVLNSRASILGVSQETSVGFAVQGHSFFLTLDDQGRISIQFSGATNLDLALVVQQINTQLAAYDGGVPVASGDNGFLRLTSPTSGEGSYLRLDTDPSSGSSALFALGLFAGTEALGGELQQTQHIDPDRQVALPGQLAWAEGETLSAQIMNRVAFQLAINADRAGNLLEKKRIAVKSEVETLFSAVKSIGANGTGMKLSGAISPTPYLYTGDVASPTAAQLEKWFAVLDGDGNDFVKVNELPDPPSSGATSTFTWDAILQGLKVAWGSPPPGGFTAAHVQGEYYIKPSNLGAGPAALNGKLLKITGLINGTTVMVSNIDPSTGVAYTTGFPQAGKTSTLVQTEKVKAKVSGIFASESSAVRVETLKTVRQAATPVSRIDRNNRVYCDGANFLASGTSVVPGDLVQWQNAAVTNPYSNNGYYRVSQVIDAQTLELVASDFGPVYLNPDSSMSLGTVAVTSDGYFWKDPFLQLLAAPAGAIPADGDSVRIVYLGMNNLKSATDDPAAFVGPGVRYMQEMDAGITEAILATLGPSVQSINSFLTNGLDGDKSRTLSRIFTDFLAEHDTSGRHTTIQPTEIVTYGGASQAEGYRHWSLNEDADDTAGKQYNVGIEHTTHNFYLSSKDTTSGYFVIDSSGHVGAGYSPSDALPAYNLAVKGTSYVLGTSLINTGSNVSGNLWQMLSFTKGAAEHDFGIESTTGNLYVAPHGASAYFVIDSSGRVGIGGTSNASLSFGLRVVGGTSSTGAGVADSATSAGLTATGCTAGGRGVFGTGTQGRPGGYFTSDTGLGLQILGGTVSGSQPAILAIGGLPNGTGISAQGTGAGNAISAAAPGSGYGVSATSLNGYALYGYSTTGTGIYGSGLAIGIQAVASAGNGVGLNASGSGYGVYATSGAGSGIYATGGIYGIYATGVEAIRAEATGSGIAIRALAGVNYPIIGYSTIGCAGGRFGCALQGPAINLIGHAGTPYNVLPGQVGDLYVDTTNLHIWCYLGTGNTGWKQLD